MLLEEDGDACEFQLFERFDDGRFENSGSLFEGLLEKDLLISGDQPFSRNGGNTRNFTEVGDMRRFATEKNTGYL